VPLPAAGPLVNVRAGQHDCYDRLVLDLAGPAAGYRVGYVPTVTGQATGDPLTLAGGAFLEVVVRT
jgi:hypothetical protein